MEKLAFAETQVSEMKRLSQSLHNLKLFASKELMDAASRVYQAMQVVVGQTTEPMAKAAAMKAAAEELHGFVNIFREEQGLLPYEQSDAEKAQASYMETLKKQVDAFQKEADEHLQKAGFTSSPWRDT